MPWFVAAAAMSVASSLSSTKRSIPWPDQEDAQCKARDAQCKARDELAKRNSVKHDSSSKIQNEGNKEKPDDGILPPLTTFAIIESLSSTATSFADLQSSTDFSGGGGDFGGAGSSGSF